MHVHHSKVKQAIDIGCYISMAGEGSNRFRIFWPQREVELFAPTVNDAIAEMKAAQSLLEDNPGYSIHTPPNSSRVVIYNDKGEQLVGTPALPSDIVSVFQAEEQEWTAPLNGTDEPKKEGTKVRGVSQSGAEAYNDGVPAGDCPFAEGTAEFDRWNEEWDAAADQEVGDKAKKIGSVVTNRYRATYSEMGHPTHCGDELAILLNNLCVNKAGTNLELFEAICSANGVDLSKYNRTSKGWQGRLRMTGRNLLAKKVAENGGTVTMPGTMTPDHYKLSQEWLDNAGTKFKPKGEQGG